MSEPVAYRDKNVLGGYYFAAGKNKPSKDAEPLYTHPDPRVAELEATCVDHGEIQKALCERVTELEVGLRECRESLDAVTKWNAPPDFNGRKIDRIVEKAIAKIDEVLEK